MATYSISHYAGLESIYHFNLAKRIVHVCYFKLATCSIYYFKRSSQCYSRPNGNLRAFGLVRRAMCARNIRTRYERGGACKTGELGHYMYADSPVIRRILKVNLENEYKSK